MQSAAAVDLMEVATNPLVSRVLEEVPEARLIKPNGGWCWYQGPRAISLSDGRLVFTSVSGTDKPGFDRGDLWLSVYEPDTQTGAHYELHDRFQSDDHNVAGIVQRPDQRVLVVYGKHGSDKLQRWRISGPKADLSKWSNERTKDVGAAYTYANIFRLDNENGRIYNFHRGLGYNPNCSISNDGGESWSYGWRLLNWQRQQLANEPKFTGSDGGRPYPIYASNNTDEIHFVSTEDHPRAYDNSIYHGFYRDGGLYESGGKLIAKVGSEGVCPTRFTCVFVGDQDSVAWTNDLCLDAEGYPYTVFSVQIDGAKSRGKRVDESGNDHRYYYARFDGNTWHCYQAAYAGTKLYTQESDYTGLAALDPLDPNTMVISTNADPTTGNPLISSRDHQRHWELFKGTTTNMGKTWSWQALTQNSTKDNLRPIIVDSMDQKRHILWTRGKFDNFVSYDLDICILSGDR